MLLEQILRRSLILILLVFTSTSSYGQFWEETSGPPASATCMVSDSQGWIYVGTAYSAVYRSSNRGTTWQRLDRGLDDGGAFFYLINQLAIGANDDLFAAVNGKGIYRSRDRGESWDLLNINIDVESGARLTVACKDLGTGNDAG
ncbi:MAG: WD40/YVTN/BNR-like repeat-containing protein, partial [Candidatus Kapaibacteriota bacterium]